MQVRWVQGEHTGRSTKTADVHVSTGGWGCVYVLRDEDDKEQREGCNHGWQCQVM
jgi:hypothetical protein